jgi:hypothetical protein
MAQRGQQVAQGEQQLQQKSGYTCTIRAGAVSPRSPVAPRQSPTAESTRTLLTSPNKTR